MSDFDAAYIKADELTKSEKNNFKCDEKIEKSKEAKCLPFHPFSACSRYFITTR